MAHINLHGSYAADMLYNAHHVLADPRLTHAWWTADNIATFGSDFYQRCTLTFSIGTRDPLLECFTKRKPVDETAAA